MMDKVFEDLYQEGVQRINDDEAIDDAWCTTFGAVLTRAIQDADMELMDDVTEKLRRLSAYCYRRETKNGVTENTTASRHVVNGLISVADASSSLCRLHWLANQYRGKEEAVLLYACQQENGVQQLSLLHGLEWDFAHLEKVLYELQAKRLVRHAGIGRSTVWHLTTDGEEILRHL